MVVVAGVSSLGSRGGTQQQSLDRLIHWGLPRKSSWGPRPPGKDMGKGRGLCNYALAFPLPWVERPYLSGNCTRTLEF